MAGTHSAQVREKTTGRAPIAGAGRKAAPGSPSITVIYDGKVIAPQRANKLLDGVNEQAQSGDKTDPGRAPDDPGHDPTPVR